MINALNACMYILFSTQYMDILNKQNIEVKAPRGAVIWRRKEIGVFNEGAGLS